LFTAVAEKLDDQKNAPVVKGGVQGKVPLNRSGEKAEKTKCCGGSKK
jgi:hypothetical protein